MAQSSSLLLKVDSTLLPPLSLQMRSTYKLEEDEATGMRELIVIEAKDLEYISSAGLRALLALKKSLASSSKELEIHHLNPVCQEVFKVTGFNNILTVK